jgi:oligosaccharide repeat unit polymerase
MFYLLAWVLTLAWYQRKHKNADAGTAIMGSYILYAVFSLLTLNDPLFAVAFEPLRVLPYIYLYVMLIIALAPVIYHHHHPTVAIDPPNTRVLKMIALASIFSAILIIPEIIFNFKSGLVSLFTDIDAGMDNYKEQAEESSDAGSAITNLPAIVYNALTEITVFLFFFFISQKEKSKFIIFGLMIAVGVGILYPIIHGSRGGVIMMVLTVIGAYMLFRRYLSKKLNRIVQVTGLTCMVAIALPVAAITVSRFGNMGGGVMGFINWYVGQGNLYFNNYCLDTKHIRHGDRTINLAKRLIDHSTPKNYIEQREKNHNMEINDDIFTTFVGDFALDFGPVAAFIIFLVFNGWVLLAIRARSDTIPLHNLLLIYFTVCVTIQGGMTLFSFSYTANLRVVTIFLLYAYLRYHSALLKRFPLVNNSTSINNEEDNKT